MSLFVHTLKLPQFRNFLVLKDWVSQELDFSFMSKWISFWTHENQYNIQWQQVLQLSSTLTENSFLLFSTLPPDNEEEKMKWVKSKTLFSCCSSMIHSVILYGCLIILSKKKKGKDSWSADESFLIQKLFHRVDVNLCTSKPTILLLYGKSLCSRLCKIVSAQHIYKLINKLAVKSVNEFVQCKIKIHAKPSSNTETTLRPY